MVWAKVGRVAVVTQVGQLSVATLVALFHVPKSGVLAAIESSGPPSVKTVPAVFPHKAIWLTTVVPGPLTLPPPPGAHGGMLRVLAMKVDVAQFDPVVVSVIGA